MKVLKGLPVCRWIAIGKIFRFSSEPLKEKTLLQKLSKEFHDLDLRDIGRIKVLRDSLYQKISGNENIEDQVKEFKQVLKQSKKDLVYAGSRQSNRPYISDDLLHPITIRLLCQIIEGGHKKNQKVTVCGGIAASPKFLPILVGMGADGISVELKRYREVLDHTNKMDPVKCWTLVSDIRNMKTKKEIIDALCSFGAGRIR